MKPGLKELIFASFTFEERNPYFTKVLILNALLFITALVSLLSFFYNIFSGFRHELLYIDLFILFLMIFSLYQLRKNENYELAAFTGTATLFFALAAIAIFIKNQSFTLIWTYFFAPFAMITLNAKRGLIISLMFLLVIVTASCYGIGIWQNGEWDISSCIRFSMAHIVMLYVIYAISNSYEKAYEKIEALREREQAQLRLFEKLSITDPLTSLYNRRSLKEIFPREFYEAKREKHYFAYILLDLDYFKSYNDTYGHQKGDEALTAVSKLMNKKFKFAFRIGGDEFAGIMTSGKKTMIKHTINKLHHTIRSLHIENKESPKGILTCSIGVHITTEYEYDFDEIYRLTDTALYKAKALGRDQVIYL
jgi:diguanylate cyclase (GGDEF)-like protein